MLRVPKRPVLARAALLLVLDSNALAQQQPPSDLVKDARNPLADQVSAQVQPNFNFGVGEARDSEYVLDLQPVVPIHHHTSRVEVQEGLLGVGLGVLACARRRRPASRDHREEETQPSER